MWTDNKGQDMETVCSECNKTYDERKEELFCLIGEIPMICYECARKYQPERSKREDINNEDIYDKGACDYINY